MQPLLLKGQSFGGDPIGLPMGPAVDRLCETLAGLDELSEGSVDVSRFALVGTRSAFAIRTLVSDPPLDSGSNGTQACTVRP